MRSAKTVAALTCHFLAWCCAPPSLHAHESDDQERIQELEKRIEQLEAKLEAQEQEEEARQEDSPQGRSRLSEWTKRIALSGSGEAGYFNGQDDSVVPDRSFEVWDARFFLEADLGHDATVGRTTLLRNAGLLFEWNLVRLGELENDVGELYADLQGVLGSPWLSLQVGRFQIPVGENYLLYSQGYKNNPFISNTVGGPWWWDEGVRAYGTAPSGRYGYVASVSDAETPFNEDENPDVQGTLKLFTNPTDWLHLSISGLRSGQVGSANSPAMGAIWLGEAFPRAFGSSTDVPSFDHGVAVPDGPNRLDGVSLLGGDAVVDLPDVARLWLAFGATDIDSDGPGLYDRTLFYWIAELILRGAMISETVAPLYVGLRANGLGTYDGDEGYLLDRRYKSTLGYNMQSVDAYSVVVGWRLLDPVTIRAEYTAYDIDLVRGVTGAIRDNARRADFFAVDVRVAF